jgi:hypothetical protein
MDLYSQIIAAYPELTISTGFDPFSDGTVELKDDSDGQGAYIAKWEYSKPLPNGMKVGKN